MPKGIRVNTIVTEHLHEQQFLKMIQGGRHLSTYDQGHNQWSCIDHPLPEEKRKREMAINLIEFTIFDGFDNLFKVKPPSGSLKHSATPLVPVLHHFWVQSHRFEGVKPSIAGYDAVDLTDAIEFPKPDHQLPYHGVETGAESAAGDDGDASHGRVEEDPLPWPSSVVGAMGQRRGEGAGEVVGDLAEDDVGRVDVEAVGGVVELVAVQGVGEGIEVGEVVGEVG